MKICIFTETYYPVMGGGETQAQLLAEGLISNGHSVVILTRRSDASLKKHEEYGKVDVHRLSPVGGGQLKKWGLLLSSLPKLIKLRDQYGLIFVSGYRIIGLSAVLVGKLLGKPVVLKADSQGEMSGDFFESGLKKLSLSRSSFLFHLFIGFRNAILKKADAFSAISTEIASEWTSYGIPSEKVHLIPNGVDTNRFFPVNKEHKSYLRNKLNIQQDVTVGIYTGRLVSYKGLPLLLRVWKDLLQNHKNIFLIVAGTGGLDIHNCEDYLRKYAQENELEKHVLFTGNVNNVHEYLQASDIFIFPTENDAFPSSIVEAMACGLSVITTPIGAIKNIVADGETGTLIQPSSFEKLYQALDVMFSNNELASQMGNAASRDVQHKYTSKIVTENYQALFRNLIGL